MAQIMVDTTALESVADAPWDPGEDAASALAAVATANAFPVPDPVRLAFWAWYHGHMDDVILSKRILVVVLRLKVRHLRFLFEKFFGTSPA
jgi:hypothetical protein